MVNLLSMEHSLEQTKPNQVNELIKDEVKKALVISEVTEESYDEEEETEKDLSPLGNQLDGIKTPKTPSRNRKPNF